MSRRIDWMSPRERFSGALALAESLIQEEIDRRGAPAAFDDSFSLMAHDLRGPLTAAKMGIEAALKRPGDAATARKILPRALAALDRGNRMIQNWLDSYALRSGRALPLRFERCELGALAQRVIEALHPEDAA